MQREIVLPETKPALEWILGRAVQKVSPKRRHSLLQVWWSTRLTDWARGRGEVGSEWRFRIAPPNVSNGVRRRTSYPLFRLIIHPVVVGRNGGGR